MAVAAAVAVGGCASAAGPAAAGASAARGASARGASASGASAGGASASGASAGGASGAGGAASASPTASHVTASAPVYGPPGPDPACASALKAEQTLRSLQGRDAGSESAVDQDFMNFAAALNAAARREARPATARAMTALAGDYTALVESQSGAAQLPGMSTVQNDGAAFDKACP